MGIQSVWENKDRRWSNLSWELEEEKAILTFVTKTWMSLCLKFILVTFLFWKLKIATFTLPVGGAAVVDSVAIVWFKLLNAWKFIGWIDLITKILRDFPHEFEVRKSLNRAGT